MDRRHFISLATAGLATLGSSRFFTAHALEVGERTLRTVSDGTLQLPPEFIFGPMPQDELGAILARYDVDPAASLTPPCNITVVQDGERTILFDAGAGDNFQENVGNLVDALDHIDIAPEDVTHVVFTHGHPDHLWGILDDFDDLLFSEAIHMMGQAEHAYWTDPATIERIGDARAAFAAGAKRRLETLEGEVVLFEPDEEILPGITAVSTPGHTPGHMAFRISSGTDQAMIVGDAIGNNHVAFERPEWPSGSDQDMVMAARTRVTLLDELVADKTSLVGFHLPDGGIGDVVADEENGYRFVSRPVAD